MFAPRHEAFQLAEAWGLELGPVGRLGWAVESGTPEPD